MQDRFFKIVILATACLLLLASHLFAGHRPNSKTAEEKDVRALMSRWIEAYQDRNAKRLAALEVPNVEIVDRFGQLHLPAGRKENEQLWSDTFEMMSRGSQPPTVTIDRIRFLRPDIAVVQASWEFPNGIFLVDGERIPSFSQVDTFVVIKSQYVWLVAAHNMQEKNR